MRLEKCPFCGCKAILCSTGNQFATEKFFVSCGVCGVETPRIARTRKEAIAAWNRRAEPENARQRALQAGICPMCEDCPDGCPIETPNDSRNKLENKPLTCKACLYFDDDMEQAFAPCRECKRLVRTNDFYRRKPERSKGE